MTELETKIKKYADAYYEGNELISDAEYDTLIEQLRQENPDSELLDTVVGNELKGVTKKYELPITMGTLAKCRNEDEFRDWFDSKTKSEKINYVCEYKMDGNSQLLCYQDGKFVRSLSRGNSVYGEDTTQNVSLVQGVRKEIDIPGTVYIRGEVEMNKEIFKKYFPNDANPRNTAAGIMRHKDGKDCDKLNFIAYEIFSDYPGVSDYERNKMETLSRNLFSTPDYIVTDSVEEILKWRSHVADLRKELPYEIDGIVIKNDEVDKEDLMRKTPLNNCAIKFDLVAERTTVKDIRWQLGGRYFSPVADVEPVVLCGATVSKASVANLNIMEELGIYPGAEVEIVRSGEVIPYISKVINPRKTTYDELGVPAVCPVCGGNVAVNSSGIPECLNEDCPRKVGHRFKRMFKVFGIKGCGDAFVDNLENEGISVKDFLEMCKGDNPTVLNSFAGGINGEKIYKQMNNIFNKEITPAQFLAIFDVKLFDEKKIKQLTNWSLDDMINATFEKVVTMEGFAEKTANAFVDFVTSYKDEISSLKTYFKVSDGKVEEKSENALGSVCFTGAGPMGRKELTALAEKKGWEVASSVTAKLNVLVCADPSSNSSKMQKARKNGTKIISYEEFIEGLN